jgi:hypothetical protein
MNNGRYGEFRGAVPLGPQGQQPANVVTCIWHKYEELVAHPPDAPKCWEVDGQHVMDLGGLLSWLTVNLTQLLGITNNVAQAVAELQVHVEARDALDD